MINRTNTIPHTIEDTCENGNPAVDGVCEVDDCTACCAHDDRDHGICIQCGHEQCPGELIDAAEYYLDPER